MFQLECPNTQGAIIEQKYVEELDNYQFLFLESFQGCTRLSQTLDGYYVEGLLSLMVAHHKTIIIIWTFAAGPPKTKPHPPTTALVSEALTLLHPHSWEKTTSANLVISTMMKLRSSGWYLGHHLWDSEGCPDGSFCCLRGGPWFKKMLGQDASDDIEVRMCRSENLDEVGMGQLELYVQ